MSGDHDYNNGTPFSPSTSTPAVPAIPDEKSLPLNAPTTGAVGRGEVDRANGSRTSGGGGDGGSVSKTVGLSRADGVEMMLTQALNKASVDTNPSGGGQTTVSQRLPRRDPARVEGGIESSAPAFKEAGCVETLVKADEGYEQDEGHRGDGGPSAARGCGGEEGLSTAGDKEMLWQQRQALLRK